MWSASPLLAAIGLVAVIAGTGPAAAGDYEGHRVLHVDSYHAGNTWNDSIAAAVRETLDGTGVELRVIHLDAKRNPGAEFARAAALRAKAEIEAFEPDVVTTSDDPAAQFLIQEHYRGADLPFVFSGLNWDASVYGLPAANVTGMVEVSPIPQIIELMRLYAEGDRLGFLTEDTPTKRKELEYHGKLFGIAYDQTYFVDDLASWVAAFRRAQSEVDMLVILGVALLEDWDDAVAQRTAETETRIPTGTDFAWLMHTALIGVGKSPEEQGRWAARAALRILDGVPPSQIPVAYNKEGELLFNTRIAARLGIAEPPPLAQLVP